MTGAIGTAGDNQLDRDEKKGNTIKMSFGSYAFTWSGKGRSFAHRIIITTAACAVMLLLVRARSVEALRTEHES